MPALSTLYRELCSASNDTLERVFREGTRPDPERLVGSEFYGYNTAFVAGPLGIRKFKKAFYSRKNARSPWGGYNCKVRPTPLDGPWENGGPGGAYQGYYDIVPQGQGGKDERYQNALFLDYGSDPRNSLLDGAFLRDYLVLPDPSNPDVVLGKAYAALGPARIAVSFFVLQRAHGLTQPAAFLEAA